MNLKPFPGGFLDGLGMDPADCGRWQMLLNVVRSWLLAIGFSPAPPEGHTLEWCLDTDAQGFTEIMCGLLKLLKRRGFKVTIDQSRPCVFTHEVVISWNTKKAYVFDFVFD